MKELKVGMHKDCSLIPLILKRLQSDNTFEIFKTYKPKCGIEVLSEGRSKFYSQEDINFYLFGQYGGKTMVEVGGMLLASSILRFVDGNGD